MDTVKIIGIILIVLCILPLFIFSRSGKKKKGGEPEKS